MEPPAPVRPVPVPGAGPCAICGCADPPGGVFERTPGTVICLNRADCDARAIDFQFLTAHGDDGRVEYTAAQMRAVATASVRQVAADVPADVAEPAGHGLC